MLKYSNLIITNLYNQFIDIVILRNIINKMNKQIWVNNEMKNELINCDCITYFSESNVGKWMNI